MDPIPNLTKQQAIQLTGGLSSVSKMPGASYGLPPSACKTGNKLSKKRDSVCSKCYGKKGCYPWPNVRAAQQRRLDSLKNGNEWVWAMAYLINKQKVPWFRWHDTGDLQNLRHLIMITQVCMLTPNVKHRLPTKEHRIVLNYLKKYRLPDNLVIRVSSHFIGEGPRTDISDTTSTVNTDSGFKCPATRTRNFCGECRACWDKNIKNIDYRLH